MVYHIDINIDISIVTPILYSRINGVNIDIQHK